MEATPAERTVSLRATAGDAGVVVAASAIGSVLNVVFQFVASRLLGPDGYGTFVAALAVGATLLVLGSALTVAALHETARMWAVGAAHHAGAFARRTLPAVGMVGFAAAAVVFVAGVALAPYLHVTDWRIWLSVAAFVGVGLIASYARGATQGAHRFVAFGLSVAADAAVRLVAGVGAVLLGFGVAGAAFGLSAGVAVGAIVAIVAIGAFGARAEAALTDEHLRLGRTALRVAAMSVGGAGLMYVDLMFAKHHLSGTVAGWYSAAGTIARIIPYGVGMIAPVVMARAAAATHVSARARALVAGFSFAASGSIALLAAVLIVPLAGPLVHLLFGAAYAPAAQMLPLYALDGVLLALVATGLNYLGAVGDFRATPWLAATVAVEAVAMALYGTSPERLLLTAIVASALLVPVVGWYVARAAANAAKAPGAPGGEPIMPA